MQCCEQFRRVEESLCHSSPSLTGHTTPSQSSWTPGYVEENREREKGRGVREGKARKGKWVALVEQEYLECFSSSEIGIPVSSEADPVGAVWQTQARRYCCHHLQVDESMTSL